MLGSSLDYLICPQQQRRRDGEAQRLRGSQVDGELELDRLLDWKRGWLFALQDAIDIGCSAPEIVGRVASVGQQASALGKDAERSDGGEPMAGQQRGDRRSMLRHERVRPDQKGAI